MIGYVSGAASDREIARDVVTTLRAVLDLAVAEFAEPDIDRRLEMRRVGRSQLETCAWLINYLGAGQSGRVRLRAGMMDVSGTAAEPPFPLSAAGGSAFVVKGDQPNG